MNKHDKVTFSWDNSPEDYYKKRIESLEKENEKCRNMIEMNKSYTDRLEKALAELTIKYTKLEKAHTDLSLRYIEEKMSNVEV